MTMAPLSGVGVLVTRPELQAMPLCRLLEAQGASTLRLPAVEIKPLGDRRALAMRLGALESFDVIIFTSANAVRFGASFLDQKRDLTLAAIGPATARALNQAGYRVAIQPGESFDTEGLLMHPRLEHVAGHRILMIKGGDGRQLLQQELVRRGATVVSADVYERAPAIPTAVPVPDWSEKSESAPTTDSASCCAFCALKYLPRLFTAACQRSSIAEAVLFTGSGHGVVPEVTASIPAG